MSEVLSEEKTRRAEGLEKSQTVTLEKGGGVLLGA